MTNELVLPYALAAFGVDYANGVTAEPTPPETLRNNLATATLAFRQLVEELGEPDGGFPYSGFVYRFA